MRKEKMVMYSVLAGWLFFVGWSPAEEPPSTEKPAENRIKLKPVLLPSPFLCNIHHYDMGKGKTISFGGSDLLIKRKKNVVVFDINRDGEISSEEADLSKEDGPVVLDVQWGQSKLPYTVRIYNAACYFSNTCLYALVGDVEIYIVDKNVNGIFGEKGTDQIYVGKKGERLQREGLATFPETIAIGDRIMCLKYCNEYLELNEYQGETSKVKLLAPKKWTSDNRAFSVSYTASNVDNGFPVRFSIDSTSKDFTEFDAIPGKYRVTHSDLKFFNGEACMKLIYSGTVSEFEIKPGEQVIPLKAEFEIDFSPVKIFTGSGAVCALDIWIHSDLGVRYFSNPKGSGSTFTVTGSVSDKGKMVDSSKMTYC